MHDSPAAAPILTRFRAALGEVYGARLARAVLYGSRARGDARPIPITTLRCLCATCRIAPLDRAAELKRLADIATGLLYETGACIHAMAYHADAYNDPRMPLMHEIRSHGVEL